MTTTAERWRDPDYEPRRNAVEQTKEADNTFTDEAMAFAINQRMGMITAEALRSWTEKATTQRGKLPEAPVQAEPGKRVAVLHAGQIPMQGFRDLLAVVLMGHRYTGWVSPRSPFLLPAFMTDLKQAWPTDSSPAWHTETGPTREEVGGTVDALMGDSPEDEESRQLIAEMSVPDRARWIRPDTFSAAVLDGQESEDERLDMAEDIWLHEGQGPRSVRLVWAPRDLDPDPYFEAFAEFRALFPVHPDTPGTLEMARAFLDATDQPHAYGEGLEFLVSRGAPDVQAPGHLRWVAYDEPSEVAAWIQEHRTRIYSLIGTQSAASYAVDVPTLRPGRVHRLAPGGAPGDVERMQFVNRLRA